VFKKKYKECVIVTIPPKYRDHCWKYFTHSFINKCLRKCVYKTFITGKWGKITITAEH